ncbi:hypothetical protein ABZP36_029202, partial [Zizania latifolia]
MVCALGAVIAKHCNNQLLVTRYLSSFDEIIVSEKVPNELLYGRAGYLWACLFLNTHLSEKTIPLEHIVCSHCNSFLIFNIVNSYLLGCSLWLAGIMHVFMHTELKPDEMDGVKNTLRYMIRNWYRCGNYPSSEDSDCDRLVHWCHGAPDVALALAISYEAAEVVWNRGLLKRVGICHGVSGNAY